MEGEDSQACIEHLEKVVRMIGLDSETTQLCRQHNHMRADKLPAPLRAKYLSQMSRNPGMHPLFWDLGMWFISGRADSKSQVSSLNQLYAAAAISNLLLVERVKVWAEATGGLFSCRVADGEEHEFVKWTDAMQDEALMARVKWPGLKRHGRAIEKMLRSYGYDPSRLLDISRNCITFSTMSDLTNALGKIVTDGNVRVERLKNRLSPKYSADETAGYRDVCINLRVVNKQAQMLGAELHCCEVQLILKEFADLKTSDGHRRYVRARNSKGT